MMTEERKGFFKDFKLFEYKDLIDKSFKEFELDENEIYLYDKSRIMAVFPYQEELEKKIEGYEKIRISLTCLKQIMRYYKKPTRSSNDEISFYFKKDHLLLLQDDKLLFGIAPKVEMEAYEEEEE